MTFLHDHTEAAHDHEWHQLTYAVRGHLEVVTDTARHLVPADRAVWVPARASHAEIMRAPISMRSLYISPKALPRGAAPASVRTLEVSPLLRELVLHISRLGALDRAQPAHARMIGVLLDVLGAARDVALAVPLPRDPRARAFAELVLRAPGEATAVATLARRAGASVRTIERCFLVETGLAVGAWRRRVRLFHALRLLEGGAPVTAVALEVGYTSLSAFGQAFARQFGRPPSRHVRPG